MMFMLIVHPVLSHVPLLQVIAPSKVPSTGFLSTRKMQILMKCLWYDDIFFQLIFVVCSFRYFDGAIWSLFEKFDVLDTLLVVLLLCFHQDVLYRCCFANLFHYSSYVIFLKSLQAASLIQVGLSGLMLNCVAKICPFMLALTCTIRKDIGLQMFHQTCTLGFICSIELSSVILSGALRYSIPMLY